MRKAVGQSIHNRRRQANTKESGTDCWIAHDARNLIQALRWHLGVRMEKPENLAARHMRACVHLYRTAAFAATKKVIAEACRKLVCAVDACTIDHNNFRSRRSLSQMLEKQTYKWCLIQDRNNILHPQ